MELDGEDFRPISLARLEREAPTPDNMPAATTGSPQYALREAFYLLELDGEDFRPIPLARRQREAPTPDNMPAATTGSPQ